jgi:uridine kinase
MEKNKTKKVLLICVSGGSGSGKTTIAREIVKSLPKNYTAYIFHQDSFYKDKKLFDEELLKKKNYDHPKAFDWERTCEELSNLLERKQANIPQYNFIESSREEQTLTVNPVDVVIIEGLYSYYDQRIEERADFKIFVDTPSSERLLRRILRDVNERGRTIESVAKQWRETVYPMHQLFIIKQKEDADIVIPWYRMNYNAVKILRHTVNDFIKEIEDEK